MARFTPLLIRLAPDQLKVRPYARRHWPEGDLLADFGRAVGLAVPLAPPPWPLNQGLRPLTYLLAAAQAGRVKGQIKFFNFTPRFHDRHRALTPPAARRVMAAWRPATASRAPMGSPTSMTSRPDDPVRARLAAHRAGLRGARR